MESIEARVDAGTNEATWLSPALVKDLIRLEKLDEDLPESRQTTQSTDPTEERIDAPWIDTDNGSWSRAKPVSGSVLLLDRLYTSLGDLDPRTLPRLASMLAQTGHYGSLVRIIAITGGATTLLSLLPTKLCLKSHQIALLAYCCGGKAILSRALDLTHCLAHWNSSGESEPATAACLALALTFGFRSVCVARYRPAKALCPLHGLVCDAVLDTFWTEIDYIEATHQQLEAQWRSLVLSNAETQSLALMSTFSAGLPSPVQSTEDQSTTSSGEAASMNQEPLQVGKKLAPASETPSSLKNDSADNHQESAYNLQVACPRLIRRKPNYVLVASRRRALDQLRAAVAYGAPVLLQGEPGSGKRSMLHYLAAETNRSVTTFYWDRLGFEEDAFLDAIATIAPSGPGRFQWRLGPVGEALVQGHWLVMEGLGTSTQASRRFATSMIQQLATLRPGDVFELPGRGLALQLHMNFRLFATRSLSPAETAPTATIQQDLSPWHDWVVVSLGPYPAVERRQVLVQRFPTSAAWIDRVLASVDICAASSQNSSGSSRTPGLAEAVRLVARLERIQQEQQMPLTPDTALLHAMDVLLHSEQNCRDVALRQLASLWSASEQEATTLALRASMSPQMQALLERMVLAPTRPTCMALRQLSVALEHEEPVLLIGEAGVGKTYLVQELARSLGRHLVVLNMSQQSDLAELVGGYQPVDAQRLLLDLARQLEIAFGATFSSRQNPALLHHLRQMARRRDAGRLVRLARGLLTRLGASARLNDTNVIHWEQVQRLVRQTEDAYGTELVRRRPRRPAPKASRSELDSERQVAATAAAGQRKRAGTAVHSQGATSNESIQTDSWHDENQTADTDEATLEHPSGPRLRFAFKEGMLAAAIRQGDLVLLDELNLAPPACLERLTGILDTLNEPPASAPAARLAAWQANEVARLAGCGMIRHPDFRLIACMNPETNIGRRALPPTLQRRFTTITLSDDFVESDLHQMVEHMFTRRLYSNRHQVASGAPTLTERVVAFYRELRALSRSQLATAGDGTAPRFSLRALGRMLRLATHLTRQGLDARRALYEGACLGFSSFLDDASRQRVLGLAHTLLAPELTENDLSQSVTKLIPSSSFASRAVVDVGGQWLAVYPGHRVNFSAGCPQCRSGPLKDPPRLIPGHVLEPQPRTTTGFTFVCTPTVERALRDIARALVDGLSKTPVLIEGPTAAGKTALVQYIAQCTGHELIRLNQHEHTEVSEYLGRYTIGPDGDLVFVEGPLVRAARNGHWVLLDELNLAPGDVLESINRLLDENRELVIPETGQVIQAHPHFALFATQNPSGGTGFGVGGAHARYAGRKSLSPAFRSRFMLIHLPEMSDPELIQILCGRYALPTSFATAMVNILRDLQLRRSAERIFAGAEGLVTARDLFRWASRQPRDRRSLLFHGRCLLVERIRQAPEREAVWRILCRHVGVSAQRVTTTNSPVHEISGIETLDTIDDDDDDDMNHAGTAWEACSWALETLQHEDKEGARSSIPVPQQLWRRVLQVAQEYGLVMVPALRRLLRLALHCIIHREPVLFVGETGIGKSTVCSVLATALGRELITINGHRHTEAADLVGRYVPFSAPSVTSKPTFVWQDGMLTMAMRRGAFLLLDEVNMVDDAVIERLNSVLEPSGQLVLSERGGDPLEIVQAAPSFRVFACMNPSGDYGKKELSTAIRNRFTEIWVPFEGSWDDLWPVASSLLAEEPVAIRRQWQEALAWLLEHQQSIPNRPAMSIRDLIGWIRVYRAARNRWGMAPELALAQGIEAFWSHHHRRRHGDKEEALRDTASPGLDRATFLSRLGLDPQTDLDAALFPETVPPADRWCLTAPTVRKHLARLYRVLDADERPILLEGPPGVGKTQLVIYLAQCRSVRLHRVNLSESTEMIDLVGTFVPYQDGFRFQKGPLYVAMEQGDWILVDELNLASQSVLEGLNAVLDHRRLLQVPELAVSVQAAERFRFFGTQNPAGMSVGRRPLPRSFLNRFWCIPCQAYDVADYEQVLQTLFPELDATACHCVTRWWPQQVHRATGRQANLRDVLRLATLWRVYPQTQVTDWARLLLPQALWLQPQERAQALSGEGPQPEHVVAIPDYMECGRRRPRQQQQQQQHQMSCWRPGVSFRGPVPVLTRNLNNTSLDAVVVRELLEQGTLATMTVSNGPILRNQIVSMLGSSLTARGSQGVYNTSNEQQQTRPVQRCNAMATSDAGPCRTLNDSTTSWALCWGPVRLLWRDVQGPTERGLLAGSLATPSGPLFRPEQASYWTALAVGIAQRWPCLLVGPDAVGKASLVRAMAQVLGARLEEIVLSNQADLTELVGGYRQVLETDTALASAASKSVRCEQAPVARFVWQPSRLLQAIQQGHWVLLRHVEAMSPALVDRLNPLLEEGVTHFSVPEAPLEQQQDGLSEQGNGSICRESTIPTRMRSGTHHILVHPEFRIFLTVTVTATTTDSMGSPGVSEALQNRCLTLWIRPDISSWGCSRPVSGGVATSNAAETEALASCLASSTASGLAPAMYSAPNDHQQPALQTQSLLTRGHACWPALGFFYDPLRVSIEEDLERLLQVRCWQDQGDHDDDDDDDDDSGSRKQPSLVSHQTQPYPEWRHLSASSRYQRRRLAIQWLRQHREAAGLFLSLASSVDLGPRLALLGLEATSPIRELLHGQTSAAFASLSTQPWLDQLEAIDMETDAETAACLTLLVVYWRCLWPWAVPWQPPSTTPTLTRETIVAMRLAALEHIAMNARVSHAPNDHTNAVNTRRNTNRTGQWWSHPILATAWQSIRAVVWSRGLDPSWGTGLPQLVLPNAYTASASQALYQLLQPTPMRVTASWLEAAAEDVCSLTMPASSASVVVREHVSETTTSGNGSLFGDTRADERRPATSTSSSWLCWLVLVNTARLLRASRMLATEVAIDSSRQQTLSMRWSSLYSWLVYFAWPLPFVAAIKRVVKSFGIHGHASASVRASALAQVALYWHQLLWSLLLLPSPASVMTSPDIRRTPFCSDCTPCGLRKSLGTLLSGWCAWRCLGRTLRQRQASFPDAQDRSGDFIRETLWGSMSSTFESTTDALLLDTFVQLPSFEAFAKSSAWMDDWFRFSDDEPCLDPALVYVYLRDEALPWLQQLRQDDQCIQETVLNGVFYRVPGTTDCGLVQRVDLTPEQLAVLDAVSHWRACYRPAAPVLDEALRYLAAWKRGLDGLEEAHPTTRQAWSSEQCEQAQQLTELASVFLPAGRFHQVHDVVGLFLLQLYQGYYERALQPLLRIEQERILEAAADWSTLWKPLALLWSAKQPDVICTLFSPSLDALSPSTTAPPMMQMVTLRPRPVLAKVWNNLPSNAEDGDERLFSSAWALVLDALLQEQAGLGLYRHAVQHPLVQDAWRTLVDAVWPATWIPTTEPSDHEHLFGDSLPLLEQALGPLRRRHETATTRIPLNDADDQEGAESALWIALQLLERLSMPMPWAQQCRNRAMQNEPATVLPAPESEQDPVSGLYSFPKHPSSWSVPMTTSTSTRTSASFGTALWQALPALVAELLDKQPNRDAAHRIHHGLAVALLLVLATRTSVRRWNQRAAEEQDHCRNSDRMACHRSLLSAYVLVTSQLLEFESAAIWLSVVRQRDSMPYFWMAWQGSTGMGPAAPITASPADRLDEEPLLCQLRKQVHQWALEEPEQAIWLHLDEQWDDCWARVCHQMRCGQTREAIEGLLEQLLEPLAQHLFHRCAFGDSTESDTALYSSTLLGLGAALASLRRRCFGLPSFRRARLWLRYHRRVAETLPIWVRMAKQVSFGDNGDASCATQMPSTRKQTEEMHLRVWTACGRLVEQLALGHVGPLLQLWALLADNGPCFDPQLLPWATMLQVLESYYGRYRGLVQETLNATIARLDHVWQSQQEVLGWQLRQPWQSHIDWERYRDTVQQGQQLERQHMRALAQQLDSPVQPLLYQYRQDKLRRLGEHALFHEAVFDKSSATCRTPKAMQYIAGLVQELEAYAQGLSVQLSQPVTLQSVERSQRQVLQLLRESGLRRSGSMEPLLLHWPQTALWLGRALWRNLRPTRGALLDEALFHLLDALLVLDEQFWAETARQSSSGMRSVASLRSMLLGLLQDMADQRFYWSCWKAKIDKDGTSTRYSWSSGTDEQMARARADRSSAEIHIDTNGTSTSQICKSMGTEETDTGIALGRALTATRELAVLLSCWPSTERLQTRLQALVEQIEMLLAKDDSAGASAAASSLRSLLRSSLDQELATVSLSQRDVLERLCHGAADLIQVMLETKTKGSGCTFSTWTRAFERSGDAFRSATNDLWTQFQSALEEAPDRTRRPLQTMLRWRPATWSIRNELPASCALDHSHIEAIIDALALLHEQLLVLAQRLAQITTTLLALLANASVSETATGTKAKERCCEGPGLAADGAVDATARDCTAQVNATEIGEELASMPYASSSSEKAPSECDASTDAEALDVPADAFDTTDQGRLLQREELNPDDADSSKDGPGPGCALSDQDSQMTSECGLGSLDRAQAEHAEPSTPRMPSLPNGFEDKVKDDDDDEPGMDVRTSPAYADDAQASKHEQEAPDQTTSDDQSGASADLFLPGDRNDDDSESETTSVLDQETLGMEATTAAAVHDREDAESESSDHGSTTETALDAESSGKPTPSEVVVETAPMASPEGQTNASGTAIQTSRTNELSEACPAWSMPMAWSDTMEPVIHESESRASATAKVNSIEALTMENESEGTSTGMEAYSNANLSRLAALHDQEREWTRHELQASTETEPMTLQEGTSLRKQVQSQHDEVRDENALERATALSTTAPPAGLSDQDEDAIVALQQQQRQRQVQGSSRVMNSASSASSLSTEAKDEKIPPSCNRARATATPEPMDVDAATFQTAFEKETEPLCWWLLEHRHEASIAALTRRLEPILEYNQLTRFAGDFRTGKRLHMRRLVDYVASNYTRDRIWMRRVRPDRRQYDIVVAVDDSASMRESGAYRLALESLVVVATALHRLELGHLGVIRFGVDAQVVHGLADGMPAAGPLGDRLMRQFTFQQEATNVAAMLQCALAMLMEARQQQTGTLDPWQLVLILSDGRLGDRETLRALVREANAHRQWLVFFILDAVAGGTTPEASSRATSTISVLDMKQVGFTEGGRIQIRRYLEDFPFPFYVIVQDMEALPFVFGDALTQWLAASEVQR